jgi:hypothetical protein
VLLGDPGAGKSSVFEEECRAVKGLLLSARDVVAGLAQPDPAGRTVFIDGLDEVRAGTPDKRRPFDTIRKWLSDHGRPRFRLSCREADWLGSNDREQLKVVAPRREVDELHLEPLLDDDIAVILDNRSDDVPDRTAFLAAVDQSGLADLLRNPLLLALMIDAATGGPMPKTRAGVYDAACRQLAREHNAEHQSATLPHNGEVDHLLDDAGLLCAIVLLSGRRGIALRDAAAREALELADLPRSFAWHDVSSALASKVFSNEDGVAVPRHRSIAEYLAGRTLAGSIDRGLPVGRVLALMQGIDGFPVEPLRGVWAWLAVHHLPSRARLVELDPLGIVLNGDVAAFGTQERIDVLWALRNTAKGDPWFRKDTWISHPFGPLATADMVPVYESVLQDRRHEPGHESFMHCVFDALEHGQRLTSLATPLQRWVEDDTMTSGLRLAAYAAWKRCTEDHVSVAGRWLAAIAAGHLADKDDELTGALLLDLYPATVKPLEVLDHWHAPKRTDLIGSFHSFWDRDLWRLTPPLAYADLANCWVARRRLIGASAADRQDTWEFVSQLLAKAVEHCGDDASDQTLYEWLGMCVDEHGFSKLADSKHLVRTWLAARPDRMKAVMKIGWENIRPEDDGRLAFWPAEARLHRAVRPRDWLFWLLEQASSAETPELAKHCFFQAAHAVAVPEPGLDSPSLEQVEHWIASNPQHPSAAHEWLENAWWMRLDHWQGDELRRKRQALSQWNEDETKRQQALVPKLPSLLDGTASPRLLYQVATAYEGGFSNIRGETPLERVRGLLVSDESTAQAVIDALPRILDRPDLPTVDAAFSLAEEGKQHYMRPAALLAARLAYDRDPTVARTWPKPLAETLVAYYLTDGTGNLPLWYRDLAAHRADLVAQVLVRYTSPKFKRKGDHHLAGLWALGSEADHANLSRAALPALLAAFPIKASESARRTLNRHLLPALSTLQPDHAADIIRLKLRQQAMDAGQRICWLVADLPYRADAASDLVSWVSRSERRAVILGTALDEQDTLTRGGQRWEPAVIQHLIEVLAPITQPGWRRGEAGIVTIADHRGDTVRALLSMLASDPGCSSREALLALRIARGMEAWRDAIDYSLRTQSATLRETLFRAPTPREVALALSDQAPSNPADLRALVKQHLIDLLARWRGQGNFQLKQFWLDNGKTPKNENDCRDVIHAALSEKLVTLSILVEREHSAAQDKRADMCAQFMRDGQRIAIPIEVKKDNHRRVWSAWHDQLERLYTIDPDSGGHGLYLVLWFGMKATPHPDGVKPKDAEDMRLLIEQRIPANDRHRLVVQVLDLSWPSGH